MKKIALIDDDKFLNFDLEFFIKEAGDDLTIYTKADDVIKDLDNSKFDKYDIVIIDIMMPRRNIDTSGFPAEYETGEILYKKLRSEYPDKKYIIISAKDFSDMNINFKKEKNVDTVSKPFSPTAEELLSHFKDN